MKQAAQIPMLAGLPSVISAIATAPITTPVTINQIRSTFTDTDIHFPPKNILNQPKVLISQNQYGQAA
jgi:hypothetical protein